MLYNVWVDDTRKPFHKDNLVYFTNAEDAIKWLLSDDEFRKDIDSFNIYLDHDLGSANRKSGYDVAKIIVEYGLPLNGFHILSMNPVGANNIRQLLTHYGYKEINY